MASKLVLPLIGICLAGFFITFVAGPVIDDDEQLFLNFLEKYGKNYRKETGEYEHRFHIFKDSLVRIRNLMDLEHPSHQEIYGITKFSDMTPQEFLNKFLQPRLATRNETDLLELEGSRTKRSVGAQVISASANVPEAFDWRDQQVISPIKNQGECGACWAISTVETIETMYAIKHGQIPQLSIQQIVDCAENGNYGCQGGDTCSALGWMNSTKVRIVTEHEYPFTRQTQACKMKFPPKGVQVANYHCKDFTNNEMTMVQLLATHGPLTVAVDATMWQDYLGGIIKFNCEQNFNHAVQIVGYNLIGPVPYYIVRNSWGPEFGLNGYLYIEIGKNLCGLAVEVATVDV